MNALYKKLFIILFAALLCTGYASENLEENTNCEISCKADEFIPATCAYSCPANLDIKCGWNFFINGSFLYWQAWEQGIDEGVYQITSHAIALPSIKSPSFKFHPAFRVGIGGTSNWDKWNFTIQYTKYRSKNSGSFTADFSPIIEPDQYNRNAVEPYFFKSVFSNQNNPFKANGIAYQIKLDWKLDLNIADFNMGRSFFVGQKLIFNPYIGLKGGKIDQKGYYTTSYVNALNTSQTAYENFIAKSSSWLIGPRLGIDTTWNLGYGFKIFGNGAASLVYEHMKIPFRYVQPVQEFNSSKITSYAQNQISEVIPTFEFILGFSWGSYVYNQSWHVDIAAGYEFQSYFNQNGFFSLVSNCTEPTGDIMLHGLTTLVKIDF